MDAALKRVAKEEYFLRPEDVARLSPLTWQHINLVGRYTFSVPESVARGELRALRNPDQTEEALWAFEA
jgi:hypothetical protein